MSTGSSSVPPLDDPDSTMALLHAALPDVTGVAATFNDCEDDDSDEEIVEPERNKDYSGISSKGTSRRKAMGGSELEHSLKILSLSAVGAENAEGEVGTEDEEVEGGEDASASYSELFNNTHDELILFEMFGEKYDDVVASMSASEKLMLKQEISTLMPKSFEELLGREIVEVESFSDPILSAAKPCKITAKGTPPRASQSKYVNASPSPGPSPSLRSGASPSPAPRRLKENVKPRLSPVKRSDADLFDDDDEEDEVVPKAAPRSQLKEESPAKDSAEAIMREVERTPFKNVAENVGAQKSRYFQAFYSPVKKPGTPSYLRPTSASKFRAQPRRDPVTNEALDVTLCTRHGHCHGPTDSASASSSPRPSRLPAGLRAKSIVSPVAQYIRASPRQRQMMAQAQSPRTPDQLLR